MQSAPLMVQAGLEVCNSYWGAISGWYQSQISDEMYLQTCRAGRRMKCIDGEANENLVSI